VPDALRVLLVVANGGGGGMQVQVSLLARGLRELGCDVAVAAGPGPIEIGEVPRRWLPELSVTSSIRFGRELRAVAREFRPDVVHGHGLRLAPFLAALGRRTLVTCHGIDPRRVGPTAAMVRATRVPVAACGEGPRHVLAAAGVRSRVLNNAVGELPPPLARDEIGRRFGLADRTLLAIAPFRLSPQKDPLTLVRAVARCDDVACVLIGGGPLEAAVRDEVARTETADRIALVPWAEDARSVLGGGDVLALSSRWEGQPTVILEAMAARVAVVATACTGTRDTVVDGVSALLAPAGDPAALADALRRARDPELRASLASAAAAQLGDHELPVVAAAHLDAYGRVLAGRWP
jgi:glycosyltransferase involved in cell wall biosynthesis